MIQDEKWLQNYQEVKDFIETNKRNPIPEQARPFPNCVHLPVALPVAFCGIG